MLKSLLASLLVMVMVVGYSQGLRRSHRQLRSSLLGDSSEEENDFSPHVFVEPGNDLCDFQKPFGPSCNMTGSNAVLTVQESPGYLSSPQTLEVEVHNASMVLLYPVCLPWVQLFGVRDLVTKQYKDKDRSKKNCRTWLRAYNSHLGSVNSGLRDLSLVNSSVDVISLYNQRDFLALSSNVSVIQHLEWQGYAGLIRDAHIGSIVLMQCNDNISMSVVTIDSIGWKGFTFAAGSMKVNTTTFGRVFTNGIQINKGELKLVNSVFKDLATYGVTLKPGATLRMENVSIERCEQPCLVVPYSNSLVFQNVTIEGVSLEDLPEAVLYSGEDLATYGNFSLEHSKECQIDSENSKIICDFENSSQKVLVSDTDHYANVTINHAADFHIVGVCNMDLTLKNSSGLYTSNSPHSTNSSCTPGYESGSLTASNTTFHGLDTMFLDHVTFRQCVVHTLHTRMDIQQVEFQNSSVDVLWLMVVGEAVWSDSLLSVATASVGQLQASRMHFSKVANLTIDGSGENNSTITDSTFEQCTIHSLTVIGSLILKNVTFKEIAALTIYLAEGARLYLQDVSFLSHRTRHVISAASKDQVVWLNQSSDQSLSELVYIRWGQSDNKRASIVGEPPCRNNPMTLFILTPRINQAAQMICNYQYKELGDNVVMRQVIQFYPRKVHIIAARNLSLEYSCSSRITVSDVEMVTMNEIDSLCRYDLISFNSTFDTITNEPTEVFLHDSRAAIIESSRTIQTLHLISSTVDTISTSVGSAVILFSNITRIEYLEADYNSQIDRSDIGTIEALVFLSNNNISNSRISTINTDAISVLGKLLMVNVSIDFMNKSAISLSQGAQIVMTNVTIREGWITSLDCSLGSCTLENVTLKGIPLIKQDLINTEVPHSIETSSPSAKPTISTKVPTSNTSSTSANQTPSPAPTLPSTGSPTAIAPTGPDGRNAGVDAGGGTQPWMRWAGAGAAIFLALLGVLAILSVAIVVRAHHRGQPPLPALSRFFGRKRDDQSTLATEMETSFRDPSVPHYVRIPS